MQGVWTKPRKLQRPDFTDGLHKLSDDEILMIAKILTNSYSDDVLNAVYLSDIQKEIITSFPHPEGFDSLSLIDKAHHLVMARFLKHLTVVDFGNMSFKNVVASLGSIVEEVLNKGTGQILINPNFLDQI